MLPSTLEKHISLTSVGSVKSICSSVFDSFNVKLFSFVRQFDDGRRAVLCSDLEYIKNVYIQQRYVNHLQISKLLPKVDTPLYIRHWVSDMPEESQADWLRLVSDVQEGLHADYDLLFVRQGHGYNDYYKFLSDKKKSSARASFDPALDLLEHFTFYFEDQGQELIQQASKSPLTQTIASSDPQGEQENKAWSDAFLKATKVKRYFLADGSYLTDKEALCASYLVQGFTMKEIAAQLRRSQRTVEDYINSMKNKLRCSYKVDLIKKLYSVGFKPIV